MRVQLLLLAVIAGILVLVPAWGGADEKSDEVRVAVNSLQFETMDPGVSTTLDMAYQRPIYDMLVGADPDGRLSNRYGVADKWEMAPDAKSWTFVLKKGVKFHDGTEMTAEDVKFSFERYAMADAICTVCGGFKKNLERVEVVDRYTVRVLFKTPDVFFLESLGPLQGDVPILPKRQWEKVGGADGWNDNPMGSGPWKFVRHQVGEFFEYEANRDYWDKERIPKFQRLKIVVTPEDSSRLAQVKAGEVDLAIMNPLLAPDVRATGLKIMGPKSIVNNILAFYQSWDPRFIANDRRVREAIARAIDMDALVKAIYPGGTGRRARSALFTELNEGWDPQLPFYPYDPDGAKQLLQEVGKPVEITVYGYNFPSNPEFPTIAEVVAGYLDKVGVKVKLLAPFDYAAIRPRIVNEKFNPPGAMATHNKFFGSTPANDLRIFAISHGAGGIVDAYWDRDRMTELYAKYIAMTDVSERKALALEINRQIHNSYGYIPVSVTNQVWAVGPRVADWTPTSGSVFDYHFETLIPAD